jgi:Spy/CpxP family protein refolding chaperone
MVDAYIISNLQESLALTDEQFVKLLPLVKRLQSDRREAAARRAQAMRQMRRLLGSGRASEAQVVDLLQQVKAMEAEEPEKQRRDLAAIDAVLTPLQQAKFRVLEMEVDFRIREIMGEVRQRRPGARPRPPARPEDLPRP